MTRFLPNRREFLVLTGAAGLQACAEVPDADTYLSSPQDPDPLQHHFALQRALSGSPLAFGNSVHLLIDGAEANACPTC